MTLPAPRRSALVVLLLFALAVDASALGLRVEGHQILYEDPRFHAAFPSVVRRADGELLVAFRRAPDRQALGEPKTYHVDPNSQLVQLRSSDGGRTWGGEPDLLYAHPLGGSQDPCLLQLRDGGLLGASYAWAFLRPEGVRSLSKPYFENQPGFVFLGGYLVRSEDGGRSWGRAWEPPSIPAEAAHDVYGRRLPAYNRGAMVETRDGRILWAVAASERLAPARTSVHLLESRDRGATWSLLGPVATDPEASFNETSLIETPEGHIVAFLRTAGLDDAACVARSTDGGRTFGPWRRLGFRGHPLHALALPEGGVLLTYGYRHPPYGIRARVLDDSCTEETAAAAREWVLRDDGGTTDLGYPWSVALGGGKALVVYYFNVGTGPRHIAATRIAIGR